MRCRIEMMSIITSLKHRMLKRKEVVAVGTTLICLVISVQLFFSSMSGVRPEKWLHNIGAMLVSFIVKRIFKYDSI